ncbi:cysteine hydrolase family protein [Dehalobacterium formicoaceticum]|uniref:Cysteine hydrolase n=1 Tax=Dehalobacterium formicoaceticum TaxID=51515 RepID=A0ABT1Y2M9_9FIRM|nr:isochorismatase family cysteine hydrolase [Dehalobacterium formicoaceticum]MCR6545128.1 cysteine hydrolase [Dehalobacterium formicoaceticum]
MGKNYWEWEPTFQIIPQETALLVIDMQKGFVDAGSLLEVPMARDQVPAIAELISCCRNKEIPVVYTSFTIGPDFSYNFYWKMAAQRGLKVEGPHCEFWKGKPETEIAEALQPLPGEKVLHKFGYDCFAQTDLDHFFRSMGIKTILITGTVVNWCVDSTVRSAYHKDYNVAVVSDAVSAFDHAGASAEDWCKLELNLFAEAFGRVLSSKEVMKELSCSDEK